MKIHALQAKKGGFKDTKPEEILSHVLRASYSKANLDPKLIQDIAVGNVLPPGGGATIARMAALHAGIPHTAAIQTVNRQCSSGLSAVNIIANMIKVGEIDIGIGMALSALSFASLKPFKGAGVESMTMGYGAGTLPTGYSDAVLSNQEAEDCLIPMGITSENVAAEFNISRATQDAFAARSFQKAAKAAKEGRFKDEILAIKVTIVDPKTEKESQIVVDADDGIRDGVTAESLGKLKPAFIKTGSTHAGNASQVSDGAAAVLLTRRSFAKKYNLPILGKFVAAAAVGVPPRIMGVGPAYAIPAVLKQTGLTLDDIDFFEINEAFASQAVYSIQTLGIPEDKVNRHGGAIAIGHPLGCSECLDFRPPTLLIIFIPAGARQVATGYNIAKQYEDKIFVTSMCIGSGMGMAGVFVNEQ